MYAAYNGHLNIVKKRSFFGHKQSLWLKYLVDKYNSTINIDDIEDIIICLHKYEDIDIIEYIDYLVEKYPNINIYKCINNIFKIIDSDTKINDLLFSKLNINNITNDDLYYLVKYGNIKIIEYILIECINNNINIDGPILRKASCSNYKYECGIFKFIENTSLYNII